MKAHFLSSAQEYKIHWKMHFIPLYRSWTLSALLKELYDQYGCVNIVLHCATLSPAVFFVLGFPQVHAVAS